MSIKASTIPYQLRPHKAIERNLFVSILKMLDKFSAIEISRYGYVGFGAPFLEDFKTMHIELGIDKMDCIEYDASAFSRQVFNNPYSFVTLHNMSSTDFINTMEFKDRSNIVWLDFASPGEIRQQLKDVEALSAKMKKLDVLKITFNAKQSSIISSNGLGDQADLKDILKLLTEDPTYRLYIPDGLTTADISSGLAPVIRAMGVRAIQRGLPENPGLKFQHLASFNYADGQNMTTITGVFCDDEEFERLLQEIRFADRDFYQSPIAGSELIPGETIRVPVMTVAERMAIDKKLPSDGEKLTAELGFYYEASTAANKALLEGYCRYYKYLPYYSKVTY